MEPSIPEMRIEYADTQLQSVNRGSLELAGSVGGYDCWDPFRSVLPRSKGSVSNPADQSRVLKPPCFFIQV